MKKEDQNSAIRDQRLESLGTLAGGIAHDLNNVLTPILMSIALLRREEKDPGRIKILNTMDICARRGADMIANILNFAKGTEGAHKEIQTKQLLEEIETIVNGTFLKKLQVKIELASNTWNILGDRTQICQVMINVCVNARDAMPAGGTLTVSAENFQLSPDEASLLEEAPIPGSYVLIVLKDNGTGMSKETMEQIFEPFFTTKALGKGTGLGLSTSIAIIKSHGGFIRVDSELNRGTKVSISLPASSTTTNRKPATATSRLPYGKGEWILVLDDEASIRQVTKQTLEAHGYRVLTATSGTEALSIFTLKKENIALVLVDMMMPEMDGPATIRELRAINPSVPILATSGIKSSLNIDAEKDFLPKPFSAETLLTKIRSVLDKA